MLFGADQRDTDDSGATEVNVYVGALLVAELAANIRAIAHALSKPK